MHCSAVRKLVGAALGLLLSATAALHDMVGLIAAEPLPLAERLQLRGDLLAFEGRLTIRRQIEPAQISQSIAG